LKNIPIAAAAAGVAFAAFEHNHDVVVGIVGLGGLLFVGLLLCLLSRR